LRDVVSVAASAGGVRRQFAALSSPFDLGRSRLALSVYGTQQQHLLGALYSNDTCFRSLKMVGDEISLRVLFSLNFVANIFLLQVIFIRLYALDS
jgi:hypothetical protein